MKPIKITERSTGKNLTIHSVNGADFSDYYVTRQGECGPVHDTDDNEIETAVAENTAISQAASAMGKKGGAAKSQAKKDAARANGEKGGRPAKSATAMLIRNAEGGWSLCRWKGDAIPASTHRTQAEARFHAASKGWSVSRLPECDA
jgi:hypothetical protein